MSVRYYKTRLIDHGAFVPIKLEFRHPIDPVTGEVLTERSMQWHCQRNGVPVNIHDLVIEFDMGDYMRPVIDGEEISELDYLVYDAKNDWARNHDRDAPEARPLEKIDLNKLPPLFRKGNP